MNESVLETSLTSFSVQLFGKLSILRDGTDISEDLSPKAQELLAYLLVFRERWHARERLAGEIWPDSPADEARSRFRRLLWRLQHGLDIHDDPDSGLLRIGSDWVRINSDANLWLDLAVVESAGALLVTETAGPLNRAQCDALESATGLFRGELLGTWYYDWCIIERERLTFVQLGLLGRLAEHYIATRQIDRGIAAASDMLRIDRAHEGAHRKAMHLYAMAGDRTRALRQFQACEKALRDELGVQPERATVDLYHLVRDQDLYHTVMKPSAEPQQSEISTIEEISARIDRLQTIANVSHDQLRHELHELRNSIGHDTP